MVRADRGKSGFRLLCFAVSAVLICRFLGPPLSPDSRCPAPCHPYDCYGDSARAGQLLGAEKPKAGIPLVLQPLLRHGFLRVAPPSAYEFGILVPSPGDGSSRALLRNAHERAPPLPQPVPCHTCS
ncbi:MAG: hypothetical protein FJW35_16020 [Acidobacteria bacterium]|nr:hypothetical protein [Acidobacteriota bacterium]